VQFNLEACLEVEFTGNACSKKAVEKMKASEEEFKIMAGPG